MQWIFLIILVPYIFLITKIYLNLLKIKPFYPKTDPGIFVSVIIACRNEEKQLPLLLSDIACQTFNQDLFELIIINDNSSDSTFETASGFRNIKNLKALNSAGRGKKKAIRTGIEASEGSLIITTDADCRIGKNWLKTIASYMLENNPEMIICPVQLKGEEGFFNRFQELEFLSLQGITAGTAVSGNPVMCNGANLAFLKEVYLKHADNLHDELDTGDDIFLLHNIKKHKKKRIMWLESDDAIAFTGTSDSIFSFLRQRARWISKSGYYTDRFTRILAIVTFVTISAQTIILLCGLFFPVLLWVFAVYSVLKSVPDFLILSNTAGRYGKKNLLRWFLPSQLVYPFYVLAVVFCFFITLQKSHINSPSLKGT